MLWCIKGLACLTQGCAHQLLITSPSEKHRLHLLCSNQHALTICEIISLFNILLKRWRICVYPVFWAGITCWWLAVQMRGLILYTQSDVKKNLTWIQLIPCSGTKLNILLLSSHCSLFLHPSRSLCMKQYSSYSVLNICIWQGGASHLPLQQAMLATIFAAPPSVMVRSISRDEDTDEQFGGDF